MFIPSEDVNHKGFFRIIGYPLHVIDCNGRSGRILLYWMLNGDFGPYDFLTHWYIQTMRNS